MSCLPFLVLAYLAVLSFGAQDTCSCTYTGYAGDACGNNPSVSVSLPTMTEGTCTQISGFEETYFDLAGLSYAGTDITSIICNATSLLAGNSTSSSSSTSTTNSTDNSTTTNSTGNSSSSSTGTCPGASAILEYQSFTVVSCQGNAASVKFYQGTTCSGNGFTITLTKGKCTNLVEVTNLGWISYQLKCNRGGGSSSNGVMNLKFSWSPLLISVLMFFYSLH